MYLYVIHVDSICIYVIHVEYVMEYVSNIHMGQPTDNIYIYTYCNPFTIYYGISHNEWGPF